MKDENHELEVLDLHARTFKDGTLLFRVRSLCHNLFFSYWKERGFTVKDEIPLV